MPVIQLDCNGTTVYQLPDYSPHNHIKMNPPGHPNISTSANETVISWSPGSPLSDKFEYLNFEVQIKHNDQIWQEKITHPTRDPELSFPTQGWQAGLYQVRVRVRPPMEDQYIAEWSDWSPVTSWEVETRDNEMPAVNIAALLLRSKPVPDPSKYFHGLYSLNGKNLKKLLNPHPASGSYFIAHSSDSISAVVVAAAAAPAGPASITCTSSITDAPLHSLSVGTNSSSFSYISPDSSSVSSSVSFSVSNPSSGFSNLSYCHPTGVDSPPRHHGNSSGGGPFSPPPPLLAAYQPLAAVPHSRHRREPQSPDSGIGFGTEYLADGGTYKRCGKQQEEEEEELEEDEEDEEEKGGTSSWGHGLSRVFILAPRSFPPAPPTADPVNDDSDVCYDDDYDDDVDDDEEEYGLALAPVCVPMGRSSSMPVDNSGYHTLKDLQTTYSSKSI
ncbi:unnamed protein product [Merluccius merluccius]